MKENEFLDGISNIRPDVVERFISMDDQLQRKAQKSRSKDRWLRIGAVAACFALIVSAVIAVPLLMSGYNFMINPPQHGALSASTVTCGNKTTGKQALIYGDPSADDGAYQANMMPPGFPIGIIIEAEVIEVLPDTYSNVVSRDTPLHVARLRIVDQIYGEGYPEEIFLCYPKYDTTIFDGYERFIMSLGQVGVENYMLINDTQSRIDYFGNMFKTCTDLGYGSVIAFNHGRVDDGFWDKTDPAYKKDIHDLLRSPDENNYPATRRSTIGEVKTHIIEIAGKKENEHISPHTYITADDIFVSNAAKEIKAYVQPDENNDFYYSLMFGDSVSAEYTRIINGFKTDEVIRVNGYNGESEDVVRLGEVYTAEDITRAPDIGAALENLLFSELKPPHIKIKEDMSLGYIYASGAYCKIDEKVYGIIRFKFCYTYSDDTNHITEDDLYYMYDEGGNRSVFTREEIRKIVGDFWIVARFPYGEWFVCD